MGITIDEGRFLLGTTVGVGVASLFWLAGPAIVSSGWIPILAGTGLALAACAVGGEWWMRMGADPILRDPSAMPRRAGEAAMADQAMGPRAWLRSVGVDLAREDEVADILRHRLAGQLHPIELQDVGPMDIARNSQVTFLAVVLAAISAGMPRMMDGKHLVRELAKSYADPGAAAPYGRLAKETLDHAARLLTDPVVKDVVAKMRARHATRETMMMGLLQAARRVMPVATSEFAWLKGLDRGLWYALDNLGRRTFHVEGLAAMDHYRHERLAKRGLILPSVATAVESLSAIAAGMRSEGPSVTGEDGHRAVLDDGFDEFAAPYDYGSSEFDDPDAGIDADPSQAPRDGEA